MMGYKEAAVIIVNSLLIHLFFTFDIRNYLSYNDKIFSHITAFNVNTGFGLLLFPPFGVVADVWLTRFQMI